MTEEEKQAALDALDTLQAIAYLNLHGSVETTQFQCIDTIRATLTAQKLDVNNDFLDNAERMCCAIMLGYDNQDISHVDFRVQVTKWAREFVESLTAYRAEQKAAGEK